ncbi:LysR family transcriptional regulator [Polaromonas sp.]|uniref:LysR family transcriptional regulator n=1 Tax=Polaromonas sp. TaxID=1869339 RepID=UPI0032661F76
MDISTLELFVEVVRHGSFAAVARDRNIDPSSVSRTISALEDELGVRLFQRTTRQLAPTEAGAVYFSRIEGLIEGVQQAAAEAIDFSTQPKGLLRVTAPVAFGLKSIVPLLPSFTESYPDLVLDIQLTDNIVDLLAGRIDLAIRAGPMLDSTLVAQSLMPIRNVVCASPDYLARHGRPKSPSELAQHNCILFSQASTSARWQFKDASGTVTTATAQGRTFISNVSGLQACAVAGMGLALLSHWLISDDVRDGKLVALFPEHEVTATDFKTGIWLVFPSRTYVSLKVRVFIDVLRMSL